MRRNLIKKKIKRPSSLTIGCDQSARHTPNKRQHAWPSVHNDRERKKPIIKGQLAD